MIKKQGSKKEIKKTEAKLLKEGYIVFVEPYDKNEWCLVARLP